jgi:hypothetical protein
MARAASTFYCHVDAGEAGAAGERFGIFVGLWAPTFMAIGNGIDNLRDTK